MRNYINSVANMVNVAQALQDMEGKRCGQCAEHFASTNPKSEICGVCVMDNAAETESENND